MWRTFLSLGARAASSVFSKIGGQSSARAATIADDLTRAGAQLPDNAASIIDRANRGGFWGLLGKGAALLGVGTGVDVLARGKNSLAGQATHDIAESLKNIDAQTDTASLFVRIGEFLKNIVKLAKNFDKVVAGDVSMRDIFREDNPNATPSNNTLLSNTASIAIIGAPLLVGGAFALKNMLPSATTTLASSTVAGLTAATAQSTGFLGNIMSKIPGLGKIFGVATVVAGGGALTLGAISPADAATNPDAAITTNAISTMGVETLAVGASIVGTNTAIAAAVPLATGLGLKAIPGIASLVAAGETIYSTSKYALNGEWEKAGTQLVAGVGETIAGVGGMLTYGTLGTAWREAVRAGGAAIFGEDKAIEHSMVYQAGEGLVNLFRGATNPTDTATRPTTERAPVYANNQQALVPNLY